MRKCKGNYWAFNSDKKYVNITFEEGLFHQWGIDFEEYESGPSNFTVGIVELPNGKIVMPMPRDIQFININSEEN